MRYCATRWVAWIVAEVVI